MLKRTLDYIVGVPLVWLFSHFAQKSSPTVWPPRKILVIKLAAAGDAVLLVPIFRSMRQAYPEAQIDWLATPVNAAIAKTVTYVNRVIVWPRQTVFSFISMSRALRKEKYDVIIDLEQWARATALLSYFAGAPKRLGFDTPEQLRAGLYTSTYRKTFDQHEVLEFYAVASRLGPLIIDQTLELHVPPEGKSELEVLAAELFSSKNKKMVVVLHPGCGADGTPREWPLPNYGVLGHWLMTQFNARLVLSGGPEERKKNDDLARLLNGKALNLGGRLSWNATLALMDRADLIVSGNTGVMHVAAALSKKQVALHGPTNPKQWGPRNVNARVVQSDCAFCPCLKLGFEYHRLDQSCMAQISMDVVKAAVLDLFDNAKKI